MNEDVSIWGFMMILWAMFTIAGFVFDNLLCKISGIVFAFIALTIAILNNS